MKALSIKEPWISLIANGEKTIETRTWRTAYRGRILLVGSKKPVGKFSGLAACTAKIVDCRLMNKGDAEAAKCPYIPGLYAWMLEDVKKLESPFPVKGSLGIYEIAGMFEYGCFTLTDDPIIQCMQCSHWQVRRGTLEELCDHPEGVLEIPCPVFDHQIGNRQFAKRR